MVTRFPWSNRVGELLFDFQVLQQNSWWPTPSIEALNFPKEHYQVAGPWLMGRLHDSFHIGGREVSPFLFFLISLPPHQHMQLLFSLYVGWCTLFREVGICRSSHTHLKGWKKAFPPPGPLRYYEAGKRQLSLTMQFRWWFSHGGIFNVSWNRPGRRGLGAAGVMRPSFTLHPIRRHRLVQPFLYFSKSSTKQCNITGWEVCKWNHRCTCKACRFQPNPHELQTTLPFSNMVLLHLSNPPNKARIAVLSKKTSARWHAWAWRASIHWTWT